MEAADCGGEFIALILLSFNIEFWGKGAIRIGLALRSFAWRGWEGGLFCRISRGKGQPFIAVASLLGNIGQPSDPLGLCLAPLGLAVASSRVRTPGIIVKVQFTPVPPYPLWLPRTWPRTGICGIVRSTKGTKGTKYPESRAILAFSTTLVLHI